MVSPKIMRNIHCLKKTIRFETKRYKIMCNFVFFWGDGGAF